MTNKQINYAALWAVIIFSVIMFIGLVETVVIYRHVIRSWFPQTDIGWQGITLAACLGFSVRSVWLAHAALKELGRLDRELRSAIEMMRFIHSEAAARKIE